MSEQDSKHPLKRFVLIALVLVVILLGLSNLDELAGLATGQGGAEGGCGGGLTAVELESMGEAAASALFSCQKNTDSGPLSCSLMLPQIDARGFEAEVTLPAHVALIGLSCFDDAGQNPCAKRTQILPSGHSLIVEQKAKTLQLLAFAAHKDVKLPQDVLLELRFSGQKQALTPQAFALKDLTLVDANGTSVYRLGKQQALSPDGLSADSRAFKDKQNNLCYSGTAIEDIQAMVATVVQPESTSSKDCQDLQDPDGVNVRDIVYYLRTFVKNETAPGEEAPATFADMMATVMNDETQGGNTTPGENSAVETTKSGFAPGFTPSAADSSALDETMKKVFPLCDSDDDCSDAQKCMSCPALGKHCWGVPSGHHEEPTPCNCDAADYAEDVQKLTKLVEWLKQNLLSEGHELNGGFWGSSICGDKCTTLLSRQNELLNWIIDIPQTPGASAAPPTWPELNAWGLSKPLGLKCTKILAASHFGTPIGGVQIGAHVYHAVICKNDPTENIIFHWDFWKSQPGYGDLVPGPNLDYPADGLDPTTAPI